MKIQYWTDLHLEFAENAKYMMEQNFKAVGDVLILAGDITYWSEEHFLHPFFDKVSRKFKHVFWIPGNHEFYRGFDIAVLEKPVKIKIRDNIFLVNNITENIDGVDFFFTPLWSNIKPHNTFYIEQNVNDFYKIKYKGQPLTAYDFNHFHNQSFSYLENALKESTAKRKVVITHHCPTNKANAKEFLGSQLNEAFVIELYNFIYDSSIDYWIFGHTHRNEPEININGTTIVSNQLGYVHQKEHKTFRMDAYFEV